jgi:hypothetical protein
VHRAQRVLETGMECSGVNKFSEAKLADMTQPLEPGMGYNIEYQLAPDGYKPIKGIVNDLFLVHLSDIPSRGLLLAQCWVRSLNTGLLMVKFVKKQQHAKI